MKLLTFLFGFLIMVACSCNKHSKKDASANVQEAKTQLPGDTGIFNPNHKGDEMIYGGFRKTPYCIRQMIEKFSSEPVANPPRKIYQYHYKGNIVFYVPALCCDFYSDLYDMDCNLIGHPDGGYSGKGDGSFPDFAERRMDEKLVWADKRKN